MAQKEVKTVNIHVTQISKLLGSVKFRPLDLLRLESFFCRGLAIIQNTMLKADKDEMAFAKQQFDREQSASKAQH